MHFDRQYYEKLVASPGKFEGESPWVPYFWDQMLNGCTDESGEDWDYFIITEEDKRIWPELADEVGIVLSYSECGFVYGELTTEAPTVEYDIGGEG